MNQYLITMTNEAGTAVQNKAFCLAVGNIAIGAARITCCSRGTTMLETPWRIPTSISTDYPTGWSIELLFADRLQTNESPLVDTPYVKDGNFIVGIGTFVPEQELDDYVTIIAPDTMRLIMGNASAGAQDGIYETPFSDLDGFASFMPTVDAATGTTPVSAPTISTTAKEASSWGNAVSIK